MATSANAGRNNGPDENAPLLGRVEEGLRGRRRGEREVSGWRDVLENKLTWEWYKPVLTSAAVSLLVLNLPYQSHGVRIFGSIIYYFSAIIFVLTLLVHIIRFAFRPSLIVNSFTHPDEGLHVSIFPAAVGMLILSGAAYTEHLHKSHDNHALRAFFWIYFALTLIFGIGSPLAQFSKGAREARERGERDFTAAAVQPILPFLLAAPVAATAIEYMTDTNNGYPSHKAIAILVFGSALHGAGILLSILYLSNVINRHHYYGLSAPLYRSTIFLAASLPALASWGSLLLATQSSRIFHHHPDTAPPHDPNPGIPPIWGGYPGPNDSNLLNLFTVPPVNPPPHPITPPLHPLLSPILYLLGVTSSIAFWGLALWFFILAAAANLLSLPTLSDKTISVMDVVFGHAAFFLASTQLLRVFGLPRALTVLAEILGVATVVVWIVVLLVGVFVVVTGRFRREGRE
ncbi:hypothetical protein EX30DRAFT_344755 [Ascodesmis nigricans]|uniref:Voltage-dependent anion channel n=1 Tax=Ascodesmis nigricans TaxID=341454 RepID=A0A4S2MIP0_9PEZI|nr:hypothetical protein EX30DRAFT_344755 [Ascodesmis nigricans]